MRSAANFKVGQSVARRVSGFPHNHPEGTEIDSFPWINGYGSVADEACAIAAVLKTPSQ
jgi:hypothetical protein